MCGWKCYLGFDPNVRGFDPNARGHRPERPRADVEGAVTANHELAWLVFWLVMALSSRTLFR